MTPRPHRYERLLGGRHRLSREEVAENQRQRLIGAAAEILAERRIGGMTVRLIANRAGVSNYTFYEIFDDVDDVLAAAYGFASRSVTKVVGTACDSTSDLDGKVKAAVAAALAFGKAEPDLAAAFAPELLALPGVAREREALLIRLASFLGDTRQSTQSEHRRQLDRLRVAAAVAHTAGNERLGELEDPDRLAGELSLLLD